MGIGEVWGGDTRNVVRDQAATRPHQRQRRNPGRQDRAREQRVRILRRAGAVR
jgi:hypothetical protein